MVCANCGARLERFRVERQRAGRQEAVLEWMICPACRHVALHSWAWESELQDEVGHSNSGRRPGGQA